MSTRRDDPPPVLLLFLALAYHALRFYWLHPEARDELTSDAGVQRIRSQQLA